MTFTLQTGGIARFVLLYHCNIPVSALAMGIES